MRRLSLFLIIVLLALTPASAQNQTGYPLPETLPAITPENASSLHPLASIGGDLPGDLAWSPDGKTLAVGTTDGVRTFDSTNWDLPPRSLPGWKDVRFNDDGNLISDGKVINTATGVVISDILDITASGKTAFTHREMDGKAVVVLTDIDSGQETLLNTALDGTVSHVVFSTDEQFAVIVIIIQETDQYQRVSVYPAAQLWNTTTGTLIASLDIIQDFDHINTIGFHVQDKLLVIASHWSGYEGYDAYVQIWDGRTGKALTTPSDSDDIPVRFSPDDQLMAFPTWEGISLWSDHKIGVLGDEHMIPVFSSGGKMLAGYGSGGIKVWNVDTALKLGQPEKTLPITDQIIDEVVFSSDNKLLAAGEYGNRARIWNLEADAVEVVISNITGTLQFSPNSQWILAKQADNSKFALWDARTGEKLMDFGDVFAINPNWTLAAQGSFYVQIVALPTGESMRSLSVTDNYVGKIGLFDATVGRVVFATQAFDVNNGHLFFRTNYLPPFVDNSFSADGQRLLTVDDPDLYDGLQDSLVFIHEIEADTLGTLGLIIVSRGDYIAPSSTAFLTPDGKFIGYLNRPSSYGGQYSSRLLFRDVETGQHIAEWLLPGDVEAMTISHDGKWLALGSSEYNSGQIILLDLVGDLSKKSLITRPLNYFNRNGQVILSNLIFSPDNSRLVIEGDLQICGDGCIHFYFVKSWDFGFLKTESPLGEMFSMSIEGVHAPVFSADGKLLVVTAATGFNNVVNTGAVQLWDMVGNKKLVELIGDDGIAAFSPDGRLLVLHEADQTVLYDTAALKRGEVEPVATIDDQDKPVQQLAFNSAGTVLYIVSDNRLWLYGVDS